jgi:phage shock protein PspC (stress-responsive transcriptional regulator)
MKAAITIELDGATFVLDEGAYQSLRSYLERAAARLRNHPDRAEVIAGLERSIGAELAQGPGAQGVPLDQAEMLAALKEVGRVDGPELGEPAPSQPSPSSSASAGPSPGARFGRGFCAGPGATAGRGSSGSSGSRAGADARPRMRRLYRLKDGQHVAGVCAGLAAFSDIDVGMIRFIFLLGTMFSGGMLLVAYVVLMFVMPLARTEAEIAEAHGGLPAG